MSTKEYDIATLEGLTGVKAHTLRMWERRYGLVQPKRTKTNIRKYDDEQLRKILNVKLLLQQGYKISQISSLAPAALQKAVEQVVQKADESASIRYRYLQDALIMAAKKMDEVKFDQVFVQAVNRYGMLLTMTHIVYPFLRRVGILWCLGECTPAQEHFSTQIIIRKLQSAIDQLRVLNPQYPGFILFLLPEQYHEIPLLFANYLLRSYAYPTYYLGPDVPLENVVQVALQQDVSYLCTNLNSYSERYEEGLNHLLHHLSENVAILVIGSQTVVTNLAQRIQNSRLLCMHRIEDFHAFLTSQKPVTDAE